MMIVETQLFFGKREASEISFQELKRMITLAVRSGGIQALMLWNTGDPPLTTDIISLCHDLGAECHLWYPVLGDNTALPEAPLVKGHAGLEGYGPSGVWDAIRSSEENFAFHCPNEELAEGRIFENFSKQFSSHSFDGAFLDRIRYPSPANGFEMLFTCFCSFCAAKNEDAQRGFRKGAEELFSYLALARDEEFSVTGGIPGLFRMFGLEGLMKSRAEAIAALVERFGKPVRSAGKRLGLDLFTPALAPLTGQDYRTLARLCDWIKPMIYRHAYGPAGLPLELISLSKGLHALAPRLSQGTIDRFVGSLIGEEGLLSEGRPSEIPRAVAQREIDAAMSLARGSNCSLHPGVEAVCHEFFSMRMTEDELLASVKNVRGADAVVLSWNLLYIPESHFKAVKAMLEKGGM
jgi:hypothetical protein